MLVRCIPRESRTQLLSLIIIAANNSQDVQQRLQTYQLILEEMDRCDDGSTVPTINYLSLIRQFGHKGLAELQDNALIVHKLIESLTTLRAHPGIVAEMAEMYPGSNPDRLRVQALRPQLISELVWGLTQPNLEQIQSLLLPLADVDRYIDPAVLERLQSLDTVILYIEDRPEHLLQSRYQQFIELAKRHTTMFPRVLRDIRWHRTAGRNSFVDPPEEIEDAWSRVLPALDCPRIIDGSNWKRMLKKWEEIDFSHCLEINDPQRDFWPQTRILPRCRNLRELNTSFTNPNIFQWAVDEKNALAEEVTLEHQDALEGAGDQRQRLSLVPLQKLRVRCTQAIVDQVMHTALDAFHNTLESVKVLHREYFTTEPFAVGEGWRAQKLKRLEISTVSQGLEVCPGFFRQLGAIQDLSVVDKLYFYVPSAIRLGPTDVSLPLLVNVLLKGYAALAFPATVLSNTPKLEVLELGVTYRNGYHAISPIHPGDEDQQDPSEGGDISEDGGNRPPMTTFLKVRGWTWDWNLPSLTKLTLSGDFAMRFRFKMLAGCPMLTILSLSILTESKAKRIIRQVDLEEALDGMQRRPSAPGSSLDLQQQSQRIQHVVPYLEDLRLNGVWQFDSDRTYEMLMEKVIGDKLREIIMYRCEQVPLETVVRVCRTKHRLRKVTMELAEDDQGALVEQERTARLGLRTIASSLALAKLARAAQLSSSQQAPAVEPCIFILGSQRYELDIAEHRHCLGLN
ncbi:hypothetical protein BGZ73_005400 [Actinomortierella ambigua]|nr:hypothetical protein BGZ73_005400 [Actinomortierella ambigua]